MLENETGSCPSCGHPSYAGHAAGCGASTEKSPDAAERGPLMRPLDAIEAEAAVAFPDDPDKAKAFREFMLKGVHDPGTQAIDAEAHEKLKERGWEFVDIYGGKSMSVGPDGATGFLLTNKLNGCVATLISSERQDGTRDVAMTHFPDLAKERNFRTFDELIGAEMAEAPKKQVTLLVTKRHSGVVEEYRNELRRRLGDDTEITVDYYVPDA